MLIEGNIEIETNTVQEEDDFEEALRLELERIEQDLRDQYRMAPR